MLEKNKIVSFIIPSLTAAGAEHQTINQINYFVEKGYGNQIRLLILSNAYPLLNTVKLERKYIHCIDSNTIITLQTGLYKKLPAIVLETARFLRKQQVTDVLAILPVAQLVGRLCRLVLLFRYKFSIHAYYRGDYYSTSPLNTVSKKLFNRVHACIAYLTDTTTLFISQVVLKDIKKNFFIRKPLVLPNSLPLKIINEEKARTYFSEQKIEIENRFIILFPGRFHWQKGHEFFVRVLGKFICNHEMPDRKILAFFCGTGPEEEKIKQQIHELNIPDRTKFLGVVNNDLLLSLHKISNLVTVPSIHEGFGNVCIEGLMQKSLLLVADVGGMSEIITDGVNGFKFPALNEEEFLKKLYLIYQSNGHILDREVIFRSFLENYTIDKQIQKITQHCSLS